MSSLKSSDSGLLGPNDKTLIRRLWVETLWPQRSRLFKAVVFMAVLAMATAAYGLVVKYIIDQGNALGSDTDALSNAKRYALAVLPVLVGITAISGLANYGQRILANSIALNAVGQLQKEMFARVHDADFAFFSRAPIGTLISKFTNDVTVISNALIRTLSNLIKDVLTLVLVLGVMFYLDWRLSLLILVVYPIAAWPVIVISKRLRGNAQEVQEHVGTLTSELKESLGGARMIKTYGLEARETARLSESFDERIRRYLKLVTEQARVDPILEVFGGLAIAGVVIFGVYQVTDGHSTPGDIAGVLTNLLVASPRIRALGTLNNVIQEGLASLSRIYAVIDERPEIVDAPDAKPLNAPTGKITFETVHFSYPDGTTALTDISLHIAAGETVALVGPSGGGKSTLLNLLPRLYAPRSGRIYIDDHNIADVTLDSLRGAMALVSQDVTLFQDTVAANIGMGDVSATREDIIRAAKVADAHDFISALDTGYDTIIGEDGDTLSGGQKQRLAIARAVLRDAPILLLDEATSALDTESEAKIQAALERLSVGRTTLVIAHRLSTVQNADRIYVIDKGQVVEHGTHKSLSKTRGGVYARLQSLT